MHHSLRLSAASAENAAASAAVAVAVPPARDTDDIGESQPLLSPLACLAPKSYVCDWAQAIQCTLPAVTPQPCQREGCDILVHHLCQGEWEQREGYGDTVAHYCCLHHPNYKYRGAPPKDDIALAQRVLSKAKTVNVQSQLTAAEGVYEPFGDNAEDEVDDKGSLSNKLGSDSNHEDDPASVGDEDAPTAALSDYGGITDYTANQFDIHERVAHFMERRSISAYNRVAVEAAYIMLRR